MRKWGAKRKTSKNDEYDEKCYNDATMHVQHAVTQWTETDGELKWQKKHTRINK